MQLSFVNVEKHFLLVCTPGGGGGVLDQWLGIGVPLRVSNPDPV